MSRSSYLLETGSDNKAKPPRQIPLATEALLAKRLLVMRREMDTSNLYSRLEEYLFKVPRQRYCLDEPPSIQNLRS